MSQKNSPKGDKTEQHHSADRAKLKSPKIEGTMPHQINAPVFPEEARQLEAPFINKYGVVIGDNRVPQRNPPGTME